MRHTFKSALTCFVMHTQGRFSDWMMGETGRWSTEECWYTQHWMEYLQIQLRCSLNRHLVFLSWNIGQEVSVSVSMQFITDMQLWCLLTVGHLRGLFDYQSNETAGISCTAAHSRLISSHKTCTLKSRLKEVEKNEVGKLIDIETDSRGHKLKRKTCQTQMPNRPISLNWTN